MAFNFPNSPTEGAVFSPPGGPTYVYNNPVWRAMGQGQIAIISDAAPSNPANGTLWLESDTGLLFAYWNDGNSSQWVQVGGNAASGAIVQTVITTSGTYTKPAGLRYLEVTLCGAGGGAPAAPLTAAGASSGAGGGGGGGVVFKFYVASDLAATTAYTIGLGSTGAVGGNSTFAGLTAAGGAVGGACPAGTTFTRVGGGAGGIASSGDLNVEGGEGGAGMRAVHGNPAFGFAGGGGGTALVPWQPESYISGTQSGATGRFPGGGAKGGANGASQAATAAAAGGNGCLILTEYF